MEAEKKPKIVIIGAHNSGSMCAKKALEIAKSIAISDFTVVKAGNLLPKKT